MKNTILEILTLFTGGFITWLWQRLKTKREQRESDFKIINDSVMALMQSLKTVSDQYAMLTVQFSESEKKNFHYLQENIQLKGEIEALKIAVNELKTELKRLQITKL